MAVYPGDKEVAAFIEPSPFSWIGFPLGGRPPYGGGDGSAWAAGWTASALAHLRGLGLGIVPVYHGRAREARDGEQWDTWLVEDADEAVRAAELVGVPPMTAVFLHIAWGRRLHRAQREYAAGWTARVDALSSYRGGVYCHAGPAETLRAAGCPGPLWLVKWACGRGGCPSQAGARSTCETPCAPSVTRRSEAECVIHQYAGEVYTSFGGICLPLNLNLSAGPRPAELPDPEGPCPPAHN